MYNTNITWCTWWRSLKAKGAASPHHHPSEKYLKWRLTIRCLLDVDPKLHVMTRWSPCRYCRICGSKASECTSISGAGSLVISESLRGCGFMADEHSFRSFVSDSGLTDILKYSMGAWPRNRCMHTQDMSFWTKSLILLVWKCMSSWNDALRIYWGILPCDSKGLASSRAFELNPNWGKCRLNQDSDETCIGGLLDGALDHRESLTEQTPELSAPQVQRMITPRGDQEVTETMRLILR